ncbi:prephenate dehydratase [Alteribacter natronophilus]|uniref:prephenate dehydratase n=1 Tax=Alteribacter natronophilus TaxID=2583810 RepID=UPI00110E1DBB|nr:prephenate dehydratase [Alteribacter natronophilus]TMW73983.1 prephenate dehydratase [Alteribacter natronophilus]
MKAGYLGPAGSFTHTAVRSLYPDAALEAYKTIPDTIDGVGNMKVDAAVVPLENTIEGSVNLTLDYLIHHEKLPILKELTIPIRQHLLVHPDSADTWHEKVTTVYSHPHAIAQCHLFIRKNLPNVRIEYAPSTAAAAEYASANPEVAAIANEGAARLYRLSTVRTDINDYENNHTRFVALGKNEDVEKMSLQPGGELKVTGAKTTLVVKLPEDHSGALHQVLSAFAWRRLNLTKIESRPMKTGLGNYLFIIDISREMDDILIPGAIKEIEALGCGVSVLGSYPCFLLHRSEAAPE